MIRDPAFLSVEDVLAVHARMIREFGGEPAVRDQGLLESATMTPTAQFGGRFLHRGLAGMAAAYLFHLCKNHAFVDGNKRTALASAELFLALSGIRLAAGNEELESLVLGVADGSVPKERVTEFVRRYSMTSRAR